MRSSTSSSESQPARRQPLLARRVWLGLAAIFVLLEIFTRTRLFSASKDFRRFRGYPARAEALIASTGVTRVAFVGNSATDRGVDARVVEATLGELGRPTRADLFVADQSRIDTWRFIIERFFAAPELRPDLVVVTFYENDLEDGNPVEIGRLAQFFTTVKDWPEVFTVNLHTLDDRASFVISSGWATYAASERIRERLLDVLIPRFRDSSERVNHIIYEHEHERERARQAAAVAAGAPAAETAETATRVRARASSLLALGRLLRRAADKGIRLCFVAYPTLIDGPGLPYELPPDLLATLGAAGTPFIDLRQVPTLRPELYADEVHLNEAGRAPYSRALGQALLRVLPATPSASPPTR
jgi:hypothetical protein